VDLFVVLLWFIFCPIYCGIVAGKKGRSVAGWYVAGLFMGIFALIWVLLLPDNQKLLEARSMEGRLMKLCPFCGERIRQKAIGRRYCGKEFGVQPVSHMTDAYRAHVDRHLRDRSD